MTHLVLSRIKKEVIQVEGDMGRTFRMKTPTIYACLVLNPTCLIKVSIGLLKGDGCSDLGLITSKDGMIDS